MQLEGGCSVTMEQISDLELKDISPAAVQDLLCEFSWRLLQNEVYDISHLSALLTATYLSAQLQCVQPVLLIEEARRAYRTNRNGPQVQAGIK